MIKKVSVLLMLLGLETAGMTALVNLSLTQSGMAQTVRQGLVGSVDVALPIKIQFINQTSVVLAVESPNSATYDINPNATISSTLTQFPVYFFVLPTQQNVGLQYQVTVQNNQITVQVQPSTDPNLTDGAIKINPMGYIYVY
jgi:hypothetical protein